MGTNTIKFLTIGLLFLATCKASSVFIFYGRDALNDIDSKIGQLDDNDYFTYHLEQMKKESGKTTNFDEKNIMDDVEFIKADQLDDSSVENRILDNWNQVFDKKNDEDDYFQLSKNVDKDVEMLPDYFELEKKTDLINDIDSEVNKYEQSNKNLFQLSTPVQHVYRVGPYEIQMQISFYGGNLNDIGNMNENEININRLFNEFGSKPDPVTDQFKPEIYEEKTVTYQFDPEIYGGNTDRYEGNTETYQIDSEIYGGNTETYDENTETYQVDPQFDEDNTENYGSDEVEIFAGTTEQQYEVDAEINGGNTETYDENTETYQVDPEIDEDNTEKYGSDEIEIFGSTTEQQYEVDPEINGANTETYDENTDTYQVDPQIDEDYHNYDEDEIFGGTTEKQVGGNTETYDKNTETYQVDPDINDIFGPLPETFDYVPETNYEINTDTYDYTDPNTFDPATYKFIPERYDLNKILEDIRKQQKFFSDSQDYLNKFKKTG